jgi:hypothetical protein
LWRNEGWLISHGYARELLRRIVVLLLQVVRLEVLLVMLLVVLLLERNLVLRHVLLRLEHLLRMVQRGRQRCLRSGGARGVRGRGGGAEGEGKRRGGSEGLG